MPFKAQGVTAELFKTLYQGLATFEENTFTVGTANVTVARNNPERTSIIFVNIGADFITIAPQSVIVSGQGIRLAPNGGLVNIILPEDMPLPSMQWGAFGDAAAQSLYVVETIRVKKLKDNE